MTWVARSGDDRRRGPRRYDEAAEHYCAQAVLACARTWARGGNVHAAGLLRQAVDAYEAALLLGDQARKARQEPADTVTVSLGGVTLDERRNLNCSFGGDLPGGTGCRQPVTTKMHVDGEKVWYGWASCDLRDHQLDVHRRAEADARRRRRETAS